MQAIGAEGGVVSGAELDRGLERTDTQTPSADEHDLRGPGTVRGGALARTGGEAEVEHLGAPGLVRVAVDQRRDLRRRPALAVANDEHVRRRLVAQQRVGFGAENR